MTKLQAKDLMVGDYVQFPKTNHIFKVQTISGGEQDTLHYVTAKNGNGDFLSRSEWEGVPLTPEILEKNGFVNKYGDEYQLFVADEENYYFGFYSMRYYFGAKLLCIVKENKDGAQSEVNVQCTYVHELQHALRLCGIEKEIII